MFDNVVWTVWILFLILDLKIKNTFYLCFYRRAIYWIDNVNVICLSSLLLYCFYSAHTDINLSKCWDLIFLNLVPCWMYHILHPITNYFYIILFNITNIQVVCEFRTTIVRPYGIYRPVFSTRNCIYTVLWTMFAIYSQFPPLKMYFHRFAIVHAFLVLTSLDQSPDPFYARDQVFHRRVVTLNHWLVPAQLPQGVYFHLVYFRQFIRCVIALRLCVMNTLNSG